MNITSESLAVLLFLMPGFVSSMILNAILVREGRSNLAMVIEALAFSFLIYVLASPFPGESAVFLATSVSETGTRYRVQPNWWVLAPTLLFSVGLPLVVGFFVTTDLHMKALRALRVTDKSARTTVWQDVFIDQKRYVIVNLSDGRRVFGWPQYYSNTHEDGQIYLYNPAWIIEGEKGPEYVDLDIHGLFLVRAESIDTIEFTHITEDNAKPVEKGENGDG